MYTFMQKGLEGKKEEAEREHIHVEVLQELHTEKQTLSQAVKLWTSYFKKNIRTVLYQWRFRDNHQEKNPNPSSLSLYSQNVEQKVS